LFKTTRTKDGFTVTENDEPVVPLAAIGVRACELQGMAIQDKVFLGGEYTDREYAKRRTALFVVAVNCSRSVSTCFCTSMNSGPKVKELFDIALTEVHEGDNHYFVAEIGSEQGARIMSKVDSQAADDPAISTADRIVEKTAAGITRRLETDGLAGILADNPEHPQWDDVAKRCINCGNCTMVCPTCFCSSVEDVTDLTGDNAERTRRWDSCFTLDYSYIHGGSVRTSARGRYRQWLTHKLSGWHEQFDTSGCVGCGRCITWCPVGIDITAEATAIRESVLKKETIGQ
jgi:ferredoxin